ncbi:MAG TPA: ABC transporter ATP-binding protein [Candidatus Obscuribacterales bacterium]
MAAVAFEHVFKIYPNGYTAIRDLCLEIHDGEFLVFVGPSGCGKSTAMRMLAGLEDISAGRLRIGATVVNDQTPQQRNVAMVFQNYALYPHMTVAQNLAFPLRMMKCPQKERQRRIQAAADKLGLAALLDRKPKALSGGQRQRVAMGRAIVRDPAVFLMDEPLSNLDAKMRVQIRTEISQLQQQLGTTMVYVTHDQVEAMTMGDRVAVMRAGELQQVAPPQALYDYPSNIFVASFIGSPAMNIIHSRLQRQGDGLWEITLGDRALPLAADWLSRYPHLGEYVNQPILVGIRPEALSVTPPGDERPGLTVTVKAVEALGHEMIIYFAAPVTTVAIEESPQSVAPGLANGDHTSVLVARVPSDRAIQPGTTLTLTVDGTKLYLFDPAGQAIAPRPTAP